MFKWDLAGVQEQLGNLTMGTDRCWEHGFHSFPRQIGVASLLAVAISCHPMNVAHSCLFWMLIEYIL